MRKDLTEELSIEDYKLDLENRIRNLLWTVSGDYTLEVKPDVSLFLRSKEIALYDGIKQGAFARYFDKNLLGLYLVKKIYLDASEAELTGLTQLCIEAAVGTRICEERPGVRRMRKKALEDILDQEYETLPSYDKLLDRLKVAVFRDVLAGSVQPVEKKLSAFRDQIYACAETGDTMELIRIIDRLYNTVIDPDFEKKNGSLDRVMAVTLEELTEFGWEDYLNEEMYEDALENYVEKITDRMTDLEDSSLTEDMEEKRKVKNKITVVSEEALKKAHTYVELNFGRSYLSPAEEKRMNYLMCRGIHGDCTLYFTEGILKNPVRDNYQYQYAKRLRNKNIWVYHDKHRIAKRNISMLTELLKKALVIRSENQEVLSDRGTIVPSRLWRVGRSSEANLFKRILRGDNTDFAVDVLIDASGSQRSRQHMIALQGYILSAALTRAGIPHRVLSFCSFWDYTVMRRFREYNDPAEADWNLMEFTSSSNNRDGLALRAAADGLLARPEENRVLIVLSDGRPNDLVVNRPNAKNPAVYTGDYAVKDTASEVRRLRSQGISVLGVFAGEEQDLQAERKIFGKDFAYIRELSTFAHVVGRYLRKQLDEQD